MNILSPKRLLALLIVSIAGFTNSAKSEIIVIDNFNPQLGVGQLVVTQSQTTDTQTAETSGSIFGNTVTRGVTLNLTSTGSQFDRARASVANGLFSWSNDNSVKSSVTINHQFSPINVLSPAGSQAGSVMMDGGTVDLGADATITLVDNNNSATFSQSTTVSGAQL
ncbi:MAG: hypothetical protein ACKVHR_06070 [Pirellulales bacterium]|jgi:hypothetical protein